MKKNIRIERACACGTSVTVTGPEARRTAIEDVAELLIRNLHNDLKDPDSHKVTDRSGAQRAREKRGEGMEIRMEARL